MSERIYSIEEIETMLFPVFQNYDIRSAVLFGSYGKGIAEKGSDIDLLVDSGLSGLQFVGFMEDVKEAVDKDVDLFDVTHIEKNSLIASEITSTGVTIYEK